MEDLWMDNTSEKSLLPQDHQDFHEKIIQPKLIIK